MYGLKLFFTTNNYYAAIVSPILFSIFRHYRVQCLLRFKNILYCNKSPRLPSLKTLFIKIMLVFTWGFGKCGQLGNGAQETRHTPVKLGIPSCQAIDSGGHFTAAVTDSGELYTSGCGKHGRLGTGNEDDKLTPTKITGGLVKTDVSGVACGIWHGAAIDKSGCVYTWGYGRSHGVTGTGESTPISAPTLLRGPFTNKVMGVSCGNNYTLLWTTEGDAFSWGCGRHGVLGHGDTEDRHVPTKVTQVNSVDKVVSMNAGFAHSGLITEKGMVYMFGRGEDGALGLGKRTPAVVSVPTQVTACPATVFLKVSCSVGEKHGHTLLLDSEGHVFSCGDGYKGKLGHGDQESRNIPTLIPPESFNNEQIIGIAAGGIHSAAVSQEGHVFTWGCGSDGRLGHPEGKGHRYLFRSDLPKIVESLSSVGKAVDVKCSYYHTVALVVPSKSV